MSRISACALVLLLPLPGHAGDWVARLKRQPALMDQEMRQLLTQEPELVDEALAQVAAAQSDASWQPLQDEITSDLGQIGTEAPRLFAVSPQGIGPQVTASLTLFTRADCPACQRAEAELRVLAVQHPDKRFEIRSLSTTLPDRLAMALAETHGAEAAISFRAQVTTQDRAALTALLEQAGHDPEALLTLAESAQMNREADLQARQFEVLGLDTAPSYVMPDRLIRGQMPAVVLEGYLAE
ncbi:hypothetical protein PSAL_006310 [Pseudooceanicola algae]|uniref:Thioredoxin-like fold domain-containing protein n=2 Tax=Pseudooceanicola algae TaxID=1537215 RepID=A0A418SDT5_9RHOB|nr:hypothetical protein PSAL_006310 [Pseudooceanicola algae]